MQLNKDHEAGQRSIGDLPVQPTVPVNKRVGWHGNGATAGVWETKCDDDVGPLGSGDWMDPV